jgi:uncharacterized protein YjbI with pentapeptide repeats
MDEEHSAARKKYRWWPPSKGVTHIFVALVAVGALLFVFRDFLEALDKPSTVLKAATVVAAVVVLIRVGQRYEWTGFGEAVQPKPDNEEVQPRKTLWDWLQLFIVPLALTAIGLWFAAQQDFRQQQIEEERAESAQQIEEQRAQDAALQAYLDQMSQLMLDGDLLRGSDGGSEEVRTLARARTQTVLARLNSRRKGSVVQFLYEASLIDKEHPVVSLYNVVLGDADLSKLDLSDANLSGAKMNGANLSGTILHDADLSYAELNGADLSSVKMSDANLSGAKMNGANLSDAHLPYADLGDAELNGADLRGADLRDADLREAYLAEPKLGPETDLSGADLSDAIGVTEEQLEEKTSNLENATMPGGSTHD